MHWTNVKRIFKSGFVSFWRNGFVSLSSLLVMTITLLIIGGVVFMGGFFDYTLSQIKNKVDINVYFITGADESGILSIKNTLKGLPEVATITYTTSDQALKNFKEKHLNDTLTLQALDLLGENPLGASLNIKAKDPSQYAGIATYLKSPDVLSTDGKSIIDKVNYEQNKVVIDRLNMIINASQKIAFWFTFLFVLISIIITLNTIRLTIFISKDEISVMRLVGASSKYVKGPFVVSGVLCGVIASAITLMVFALGSFYLLRFTDNYFAGFSFLGYYAKNFLPIFLIICGSGIVLGAVASYLAVVKYLKD
ncbi:MAG: permease-like cell division protein FtsX [Minisyncoccia bacterium]